MPTGRGVKIDLHIYFMLQQKKLDRQNLNSLPVSQRTLQMLLVIYSSITQTYSLLVK